ncbi:predicted protein [Arabidopsis lyrata subsp. lyrata]|uniref:Predicted protein n=1 Tax=Arabidopsis lyrata subsp. lyrata TaxID=81972 RepID=D7KUS4_ARALL|nr:predicted protein [Arabidopsis lyrata subsp. lyrata]
MKNLETESSNSVVNGHSNGSVDLSLVSSKLQQNAWIYSPCSVSRSSRRVFLKLPPEKHIRNLKIFGVINSMLRFRRWSFGSPIVLFCQSKPKELRSPPRHHLHIVGEV